MNLDPALKRGQRALARSRKRAGRGLRIAPATVDSLARGLQAEPDVPAGLGVSSELSRPFEGNMKKAEERVVSRRPGLELGSFFASLLIALAALLVLARALSAQEAGKADEKPLFVERVDVEIINVEVFVTDSDGNRVRGLTVDDFELFEDGQPVEISNFYATEPPPQVDSFAADRQLVESRGQASAPTVAPVREVPKEQRQHMAVFVDDRHIAPGNRNRVLKELGLFLEDRVRAGDYVTLVRFDGSFETVQVFTRDMTKLAQGVEKLAKGAPHSVIAKARERKVRQVVNEIGDESSLLVAIDEIRGLIQERRLTAEQSFKAISIFTKSLGGLPGRKAILHVSDGIERAPGQAILAEFFETQIGRPNRIPISRTEFLKDDLTQVVEAMTREANAQQVTIYTLDASGPTANQSLRADSAPVSAQTTRGQGFGDTIGKMSAQEVLVELAADTGGSAILNTFNFGGAFESMSKDISSSYSLGFRARHGGDGKFHRIRVEVKRPGLKARHRTGYADKSEIERVVDKTLSSLLLDLQTNPLGIQVEFGTPVKAGVGKYHVPVLVSVPLSNITVLPNGGFQEGRLKVLIAVSDDGEISEVQEIPFPVKIKDADYEKHKDQAVGYAGKLLVRDGTPKVAITVWDELSGIESLVPTSVQVGKQKKVKADKGTR